jgi:hypothetical protein
MSDELAQVTDSRLATSSRIQTRASPGDFDIGILWNDARELDHLGPLFNIFGDELAKVGG